jgi:hypothetical protein
VFAIGRTRIRPPDLQARAGDHDVRGIHERIARALEDVGGNVAVRGVLGGARQHVGPEVELVISGRGGVVLHRIEGVHHRMGPLCIVLGEVRRERVAFDQVARIHQDDLVRILRPQHLNRGRGARQSPRGRDVSHVIPPEHTSVHVRGRDDNDVRGIGTWGGGRRDGLLDGQRRQEQIHSALKIAEGERVALPWTTAMTESVSHRILCDNRILPSARSSDRLAAYPSTAS